ncbi:uncharacterized protein [Primulina huaijiensis]|uniref:uncharacterized protein n=1 Tax=Primulina huaijiensis TaxID=1492673 RepID=UPI003CC76CBE
MILFSEIQCNVCTFVPSFRYLGIPLAAKQLKSSDYCKIVDAIAAKINSWPRHSLYYAGKLELIRSVIQAWETLCKLLSDGGLGLKNLRGWNLALIAKTLWKIHLRKDNLWIKWVNHFYSSFGDIWKWRWHKDDSPLIKQILSIRDVLIQRMGSVEDATGILHSWFHDRKGLNRAYIWFANSVGRWPWKPLLNCPFILPKHKVTLWLMAHSKLLTRDRLPFATDKSCVLCNSDLESINHLFFESSFSAAIWIEVRKWLGMRKIMGSSAAILRAFRTCYRGNSMLSRMRITALASTIYCIWNARNKKMFDDDTQQTDDLVRRVKINVFRCILSSIDVFQYVMYQWFSLVSFRVPTGMPISL